MIGRSSNPAEPTLYGDLTMADAERAKRKGDARMRRLLADPKKAEAFLRDLGITKKKASAANKTSTT